jgi:hypothetical protein
MVVDERGYPDASGLLTATSSAKDLCVSSLFKSCNLTLTAVHDGEASLMMARATIFAFRG